MSEQLNLKTKIQDLFDSTPDSINSVSYGRKYKSGSETNDLCIVFGVDKKKRIQDLTPEEILPSEIIIDGKKYLTDVIETTIPRLITCHSFNPGVNESDSNIQKLRGNPNLLTPLKGGQEIIKFPTDWIPAGAGLYNVSIGTLGFFAVDNNDNKVVGVTNTHVAVSKLLYCNDEKNLEGFKIDPYNTCLPDFAWVNGTKYHPGQLCRDTNANTNYLTCQYIKRYKPFSTSKTNYIDAALLVMNPTHVDSNSYKIHQADGVADYTAYMPFATTAELDNLLNTDPTVYSTGRTTGPKGYGATTSCQLRITNINYSSPVGFDEGTVPFADTIMFKYRDNSNYPAYSGDSGSAVVAVIGGVRKIIGLVFASDNLSIGLIIRIDRIANDLNIRAWDSNYTLNTTLPTPEYRVAKVSFGYGGSDSVVIGGKRFYQAGFIKRNNPTFIENIPFGLAPVTTTPSATVLTVTNSSASAYLINGSDNPTLNLIRGLTYTFNISAVSHPFWIKTTQTTGQANAYSTGITANGTASGTLTFVVDAGAPSTLYYNCEHHSSMRGVINISG